MPELDLSPAPGAAPRQRMVLAHARTEATLLLRNGEQLLLALVIPLLALVAGLAMGARFGLDRATWPASVLALALWSSTFTSVAIATAFERRYGVLERLAATPLGKGGLLSGKALAVTSVLALQLVVLLVVALVAGWRPSPAPLPWLLAVVVGALAAFAFVSLALVLAGRLRAEAVLGLANLVYLVLVGVGALVMPLAAYPGAVRPLVALLPTAAVGEAFRAAAQGVVLWWPLAVVAVWAGMSGLLSRKVFQWMQ